MKRWLPVRRFAPLAMVALATSLALAQSTPPPPAATTTPATPAAPTTTAAPATPTPPATPTTPATPPSPVSGIRNKISAGDLLSAESILEVYRERNGANGAYLMGLSWVARGAYLLGDREKAARYVAGVRAHCADSLSKGVDLEKSGEVELALGAAIETEAQMIRDRRGAKAASQFVQRELANLRGPVALRSRLNKRLNMIAMIGSRAPELMVEDWLGEKPPELASLRGKPVLLYLWLQTCGDCRSQAPALARAMKRHAASGLQTVALTRYYEEPTEHAREKARADSVWQADYKEIGAVPRVISTASMERYGGSSTPTFVFVDREGVVRDYLPVRLTDAEFDRALAAIVK